jgi:Holliday junction resolvasome RuvABC endonuclease subunit
MSRILAVDIGSRTLAIAFLYHGPRGGLRLSDTWTIAPPASWPIGRRLAHIDDEFAERIPPYEDDVVAVEEPWPIVGRKDANNALWRVVGHCECMANQAGANFRLVPVRDWRRTNGIKGRKRADLKAATIQAVKTIFGKTLPEDEAEAALIARHVALTLESEGE